MGFTAKKGGFQPGAAGRGRKKTRDYGANVGLRRYGKHQKLSVKKEGVFGGIQVVIFQWERVLSCRGES